MTSYAFALFWIVCGGVAWKIASSKGGKSTLWVVLGQVFGPFSILAALLVGLRSKHVEP